MSRKNPKNLVRPVKPARLLSNVHKGSVMPNYQVISKEHYANKRWLRFSSYAHAEREALMPLTSTEMPKALMSLPIGFSRQDERYVPVAVMNIQPGKNLFVAPNGVWAGRYVPAAFRSYPFLLGRTPEGQQVLCIDEDAGLVGDGPDGEPFFDEDGQPSKPVLETLEFLNQLELGRQATAATCAVLAKHGLFQPWPIVVQGGAGEQKSVEGLFRIDEVALNKLSADALQEVSSLGGLAVAYCQLLSMQHLPLLARLAEAHAKAAKQPSVPVAPVGELNLEFLNKSETISFGGLG